MIWKIIGGIFLVKIMLFPKNIINDNKKDDNEYEFFMVDSVT